MEFTVKEMTWLCQVIKIKKIAGFKPFAVLSNEDVDTICTSLSKKGILDKDTLTEVGLATVEIVSLYANAKRFIKIGSHGVFANYQDEEYVLIVQQVDTFTVDLVGQDRISGIILSKFKTLQSIKDGDYQKKFISHKKFSIYMEEHKDAEAIFYYKVDLDKKTNDKAVLYIAEGFFQHYHAVSEELHRYPRALVQQGIESIFSKEEV